MEKKFLEGLMIRMFLCQHSLHPGPQIFQKSRNHFQILGIITVTEQVLYCGPCCYPSFSTQCVWCTFFGNGRGKNCCNYAGNIKRHCTQFNCLVFVHPWVMLKLCVIDLMFKIGAFVLVKDWCFVLEHDGLCIHMNAGYRAERSSSVSFYCLGILCQRSTNLLKF
jgi:hypothetical protein